MSGAGRILGHIDCPTCGTAGAMRITRDKNGDPFGFCEAGCNQQMRIGGSAHRVRAFVKRYPWAAPPAPEAAPAPAPAAPAAAPAKPAAAPAPAKKRGGAGFFDSLLGGAAA